MCKNMKLCDKLKKYCTDNGIQKSWFAEKIGMTPAFFYHILAGRYKLTSTYWVKVIEVTQGQITFTDLIEEEYKDLDFVNVSKGPDATKCGLTIKIS